MTKLSIRASLTREVSSGVGSLKPEENQKSRTVMNIRTFDRQKKQKLGDNGRTSNVISSIMVC